MGSKKKESPYYRGDSVPLSFKVADKDGDVSPSAATVTIYNIDGTVLEDALARIEDNTVSYVVDGEYTKNSGAYMAEFTISLPPSITRTHKMGFGILPKGIIVGEIEDDLLMPVNEDSDEKSIFIAISMATRELRRRGYNARDAERTAQDLARKKTGKLLTAWMVV